jgi:chemotaxis protein methyltransferase CheR
MYRSSESEGSISLSERNTKAGVEHPGVSLEADFEMDQEMLLREMQHRVANSLQIVANILSLKARTVKSQDARLHLMDAHNRIISIAAVQRQLLASRHSGMIQIDDYLSELSEGLATSLTEKVGLSVVVDGTARIESNRAVAIGLIMTELIINAIKHAFPPERRGEIIVAYHAMESGWSLSVSDNGVGLPNPAINVGQSGYGTRIVEALAKELDARVLLKSSDKGTCVSLVHSSEHDGQELS